MGWFPVPTRYSEFSDMNGKPHGQKIGIYRHTVSRDTILFTIIIQFSSVAQSCLTLCNPMNCSTPGLPVHHQARSLLKLMSIELVMPSKHLILCHSLLLLPSIFPNIRAFSSESVLCIRWPKYWSFSFNISPPMNTQD